MSQRTRNKGWYRWWRLGLAFAGASAGLIVGLGSQYNQGLPTVPAAVAQPLADVEPDGAAVVAPAEEADEAELTPDDVAADAEAQANGRPTHAEIKERLRIERSLVQGRRPGAAPAPRAGVNAEAAHPTKALADQHQRVLATRATNPPPAAAFLNPNGPPRLDAGEPNPDRQRPVDAEAAQ